MSVEPNLKALSDDELLRRLLDLLRQSRCVEADLVTHIAEVDARRLYAREAVPSMFEYCTRVLQLSEQEAYLRITVARTSREYPMLVTMLRDGRLHLSAIVRLAPHLTPDNAEALLGRATHRSKRQIEELVAELAPRPDAATVVRKLPERRGKTRVLVETQLGPDRVESLERRIGLVGDGVTRHGAAASTDPAAIEATPDRPLASPPAPRAVIQALAPARYRVQFTASAELRDKLERLQALMRSSVPDGDLASIIERAVTEKLERLEARRYARTNAPRKDLAEASTRPRSRYIPAAVRRVVEERDGGRCTYRDKLGRRCTRLYDLEFHHRTPFAQGGDHSVEGLCLMCRTHNALMAEDDYGKEAMARFRRSAPRRDLLEPDSERLPWLTRRPATDA